MTKKYKSSEDIKETENNRDLTRFLNTLCIVQKPSKPISPEEVTYCVVKGHQYNQTD